MEKVIRDGRVAVLYSPGYGAGWSTWSTGKEMMYHPRLVEWVESGKVEPIEQVVEGILGVDNHFYMGGAENLTIEWLPVGTHFKIDEYDGFESVVTFLDFTEVA